MGKGTDSSQKRKHKWPKNTYIKTYQISLIILKIEIKTIIRWYFIPTRLAKISLTIPSAREDVKQERDSYIGSRSINCKGKHFGIAW